jgi:hypothetical protein
MHLALHALYEMKAHIALIHVYLPNEFIHTGDENFPLALYNVDLAGGECENVRHLAQLRPCVVQSPEPYEILKIVFALGKGIVVPVDGDDLVF